MLIECMCVDRMSVLRELFVCCESVLIMCVLRELFVCCESVLIMSVLCVDVLIMCGAPTHPPLVGERAYEFLVQGFHEPCVRHRHRQVRVSGFERSGGHDAVDQPRTDGQNRCSVSLARLALTTRETGWVRCKRGIGWVRNKRGIRW